MHETSLYTRREVRKSQEHQAPFNTVSATRKRDWELKLALTPCLIHCRAVSLIPRSSQRLRGYGLEKDR